MTNLYVFEYFNSKKKEYPDFFDMWFEQADDFAHQVLSGWSDDDIAKVLRQIDRQLAAEIQFVKLHADSPEPEYLSPDNIGTVTGRAGYAHLYNLFRKDGNTSTLCSGCSWPEIFAVYTLGLIAYANRDILYMEDHDELNKNELIMELCGEYLNEAVEAATTARMLSAKHLKESELVQRHFSHERTQIASKGGKAKAGKYAPLKTRVIELYREKYQAKSNRQAAKLIWKELKDTEKLGPDNLPILVKDSEEERLAKWIAEYKRSHH